MANISDRKYAEDMGLTLEQVRKMIRRLDIPFFSTGKGDTLVYMFDPEQLDKALSEQKSRKRQRRRRRGSGSGENGND